MYRTARDVIVDSRARRGTIENHTHPRGSRVVYGKRQKPGTVIGHDEWGTIVRWDTGGTFTLQEWRLTPEPGAAKTPFAP
jgi:hypothetical protein